MMMLRLGNKIATAAVVVILLLFVPFVCQAQGDDEDEMFTCIVCPDDLRVTNPQSIVQPPNQPALTCADIQENGRRGLIRPQNVCAATKLAVPLLCGCGSTDDEGGDTMDPTTLEPTSKPTSSPSFAPSPTPPPTATPVASPDPSKSSIRSHSGDEGGADQSVDQSILPIDDEESFGSSSSYIVISSTVSMLVAVSFSAILC